MQELKFNSETGVHILNDLPKSTDVGSYMFTFEVILLILVDVVNRYFHLAFCVKIRLL